MTGVELVGVTHHIGDVRVLDDLSLRIVPGELFALVGPSGCGKTTVLRLIAGLARPTTGSVLLDGRPVDALEPWRNGVGMVFQDEALYEHLDVTGNLAFPWRAAGTGRGAAEEEANRTAARLGIRGLLDRMPPTLSGGERGMVAAGRAVSRDLRVLVLDEPLAKADAGIRRRFRSEIRRLHDEEGVTTVLATNDWDEAAIADRVAIIDAGRLHQVGPPRELFDHPADTFVAGFAGSASINLIPAAVEREGGASWLRVGPDRIRLPRAVGPGRVVAGIRPHHLAPAGPSTPFDHCLHVTVGLVSYEGSRSFVRFGLGSAGSAAYSAVAGPDLRLHPGDRFELEVDVERIHLFDAESGLALG
jgi:ABC-type sugar transport system ATPase subunit